MKSEIETEKLQFSVPEQCFLKSPSGPQKAEKCVPHMNAKLKKKPVAQTVQIKIIAQIIYLTMLHWAVQKIRL